MRQNWVCKETAACDLGDARLNRRLGAVLEAIGERPGKSLPTAFQDWANTKAAYRFFANGSVSEDKILEGQFAASAQRIQATDGPILILQDTRYCNLTSGNSLGAGATSLCWAGPGTGDPLWYSMELQNHPWRSANGRT